MDVRDRAMLMLFAIYGLRESEVEWQSFGSMTLTGSMTNFAYRVQNGVSHKFTRFSLRSAGPSPITCCRSADRLRIVRYS